MRGYDCGYGGSFRPLSIANYFQEAAGDHALILGVGMDAMFSQGRTWMLSRIDIEIEDLPRSGDEVIVRTWPAGTDRIFAMRYIELLSSDGRLLAGALYDYFIVDLEKRRPMRPEKILNPTMRGELPAPYPDLSPGVPEFPGFDGGAPEGWTEAFTMRVGPRHIDYNGHVNNAHFIDWLCDAIPVEKRGSGRAARIKVDFVSEVKAGEEVTAYWADGDVRGSAAGSAFGGAGGVVFGNTYSLLLRGGDVVAKALSRWA